MCLAQLCNLWAKCPPTEGEMISRGLLPRNQWVPRVSL